MGISYLAPWADQGVRISILTPWADIDQQQAHTVLHGVVAPCYQNRYGGVYNKVPQLHTMLSEPLD